MRIILNILTLGLFGFLFPKPFELSAGKRLDTDVTVESMKREGSLL